jgi:hypothetical protein
MHLLNHVKSIILAGKKQSPIKSVSKAELFIAILTALTNYSSASTKADLFKVFGTCMTV